MTTHIYITPCMKFPLLISVPQPHLLWPSETKVKVKRSLITGKCIAADLENRRCQQTKRHKIIKKRRGNEITILLVTKRTTA
jgi:hypothetical protein